MTTLTVQDIAARLSALEAEVADVLHVQARRAERVLGCSATASWVRSSRSATCDERTRALQALAQSDRRAAFATADRETLLRVVLEAPADVRAVFLADAPAHTRDTIEVHVMQLPKRVRITEDRAASSTMRSAFEIWFVSGSVT